MRLFCFSLFWLCVGASVAQVSFQAVCNASQVLTGETFHVAFQLDNAQGQNFMPPDFSPFTVVGGPSRGMRTTIVNGRMSSSESYTYELLAHKAGKFIIGRARVWVGGRQLETQPLTIEVIKNQHKSSAAEIFVLATVSRSQLYEGQQCMLTYKLYTQWDIAGMEAITKPVLDGFHVEYLNLQDAPMREVYQGKSYTTKVISRIALYPIVTGKLIIPPVSYKVAIRGSDPFSSFSMPSLFSAETMSIASNEVIVYVKELPKPAPEGFSGAVGNFEIQVRPLNKRFSLHDVIALSYTIKGTGNFNAVEPIVNVGQMFEVLEAKSGGANTIEQYPSIVKSKVFDCLILPKDTGVAYLSPSFIYFDPDSNRYLSLSKDFELEITPVAASNQSIAMPDDRLIKDMKLHFNARSIWKSKSTYALTLLPLAAWLAAEFFNRQKMRKVNGSVIQKKYSEGDPIAEFENWMVTHFNQLWNTHYLHFRQLKQHQVDKKELDSPLLALFSNYEYLKFSGRANADNLLDLKNKLIAATRGHSV